MGTEFYTFDIFDTALTWVSAGAPGAYLEVGRRWRMRGGTLEPEHFMRERCAAEGRSTANKVEPTLDDIYAEMWPRLSETDRAELIELEFAVLREFLRPVVPIQERIARLRSEGKRIAFISDMHLPSKFLRELLERDGLCVAEDPVYVSCEHGRSKHFGELYTLVAELEGVRPASIEHCGDNRRTDVANARKMGLAALHFGDTELNRYEKLLRQHSSSTLGVSDLFAGASRLVRLTQCGQEEERAALWEVSAGVVAPVLVAYVLHVLLDAARRGVSTLYFVSRDGQVLLRIARLLAPRLGLDMELRYLYGSRNAWSIPDPEELDAPWIWGPLRGRCSVRALLSRLEVEPDAITAELSAAGFPPSRWEETLDVAGEKSLRRALDDTQIQGKISDAAEGKTQLIADYLSQEGLVGDQLTAMVDLGWSGTLYRSLAKALPKEVPLPLGYYYGVTDEHAGHPETLLAYAYDQRSKTGLCAPEHNALLEMFCSADHGTVLRLSRRAGKVGPELEMETNDSLVRWGLGEVWAALDAFVGHLQLPELEVLQSADLRPVCLKLLESFVESPTHAEARAWGGIVFEEQTTNQGSHEYPWARPLTVLDLARTVRRGRAPKHFGFAWSQGSMALTPPAVRTAITGYLRVSRAVRRRLG